MIHCKIKPRSIGVFGSSFDPLHLGHIRLMVQVQKDFFLDKIKIIPAYHNPLKPHPPVVSALHRLEIVKKTLKPYSFLEVDDQEIQRGNLSYTIETLQNIQLKFSKIFLIIGKDQLQQFNQWKDFEKIIEITHLIVCSRKGLKWTMDLFPKKLRTKIKHLDSSKVVLTTGRVIYRAFVKDLDISSSEIRRRIAHNQSVQNLVPALVNQWIVKHGWYQKLDPPPLLDLKWINFCVQTLQKKKAQDIQVFDFRKRNHFPCLYALVVSGQNTRHTKIMADFLLQAVKKQFSKPSVMEGRKNGQWIVIDYGDLMVHIFYHYTREYYQLENAWKKDQFSSFS